MAKQSKNAGQAEVIVYNPLDKKNLAQSIERTLLTAEPMSLPETREAVGAGIYVIYYTGDFRPYAPIADANRDKLSMPIYVGKAIPKGGRKGGLTGNAGKGKALADRLSHHTSSIEQASNIEVEHFKVRLLPLDDVWIPLGENVVIETFKPLWNVAVDGFGNKDPGRRRSTQFKSPWDVLHPGREFAVKLADSGLTPEHVEGRIEDFFAGRPLRKLPRKLEEALREEQEEIESEADES